MSDYFHVSGEFKQVVVLKQNDDYLNDFSILGDFKQKPLIFLFQRFFSCF